MEREEWVNGMQCCVICSLPDLHFSLVKLIYSTWTPLIYWSGVNYQHSNSTEKAGWCKLSFSPSMLNSTPPLQKHHCAHPATCTLPCALLYLLPCGPPVLLYNILDFIISFHAYIYRKMYISIYSHFIVHLNKRLYLHAFFFFFANWTYIL